jgi:hypothetical protein
MAAAKAAEVMPAAAEATVMVSRPGWRSSHGEGRICSGSKWGWVSRTGSGLGRHSRAGSRPSHRCRARSEPGWSCT